MGGVPNALVWLKRNIDFETCDIMLSDWKYSGEFKTSKKMVIQFSYSV